MGDALLSPHAANAPRRACAAPGGAATKGGAVKKKNREPRAPDYCVRRGRAVACMGDGAFADVVAALRAQYGDDRLNPPQAAML